MFFFSKGAEYASNAKKGIVNSVNKIPYTLAMPSGAQLGVATKWLISNLLRTGLPAALVFNYMQMFYGYVAGEENEYTAFLAAAVVMGSSFALRTVTSYCSKTGRFNKWHDAAMTTVANGTFNIKMFSYFVGEVLAADGNNTTIPGNLGTGLLLGAAAIAMFSGAKNEQVKEMLVGKPLTKEEKELWEELEYQIKKIAALPALTDNMKQEVSELLAKMQLLSPDEQRVWSKQLKNVLSKPEVLKVKTEAGLRDFIVNVDETIETLELAYATAQATCFDEQFQLKRKLEQLQPSLDAKWVLKKGSFEEKIQHVLQNQTKILESMPIKNPADVNKKEELHTAITDLEQCKKKRDEASAKMTELQSLIDARVSIPAIAEESTMELLLARMQPKHAWIYNKIMTCLGIAAEINNAVGMIIGGIFLGGTRDLNLAFHENTSYYDILSNYLIIVVTALMATYLLMVVAMEATRETDAMNEVTSSAADSLLATLTACLGKIKKSSAQAQSEEERNEPAKQATVDNDNLSGYDGTVAALYTASLMINAGKAHNALSVLIASLSTAAVMLVQFPKQAGIVRSKEPHDAAPAQENTRSYFAPVFSAMQKLSSYCSWQKAEVNSASADVSLASDLNVNGNVEPPKSKQECCPNFWFR